MPKTDYIHIHAHILYLQVRMIWGLCDISALDPLSLKYSRVSWSHPQPTIIILQTPLAQTPLIYRGSSSNKFYYTLCNLQLNFMQSNIKKEPKRDQGNTEHIIWIIWLSSTKFL